MPAHEVGACWVEFATLEAHFNGDRSKNTGLTGASKILLLVG
jgi:hypothetical protein